MAEDKDPSVLERQSVSAGMTIIREGEKGKTAYLIQSGCVNITVSKAGKEVELAQMGAGDIFGEMALVAEATRTATVKAVTDTNLIVITKDLIDRKLSKSDPTIRALLPMLMKRLEQTNNALLNKGDGLDSLMQATKTIYKNIELSLPPSQKKTLANSVKPKLDDLLVSVKQFEKKYKDG